MSDTGIGIHEQDREAIFERFGRSEESLINWTEGAGLGLAIAREIVEVHGGTIRVESEVGRGSSFILSLPVPTGRPVGPQGAPRIVQAGM